MASPTSADLGCALLLSSAAFLPAGGHSLLRIPCISLSSVASSAGSATWLLGLSLLTLALFLLSPRPREFVLLLLAPAGIWSCVSCRTAPAPRPAGPAGGASPLPAAVPCSR